MRPALIAGLLLCLSACGFTPVYQQGLSDGSVLDFLGRIEVPVLPDRLGQMVRNGLQDRLVPQGATGAADYRFDVTLSRTKDSFGFRRDESITRESVRIDATYRLINLTTDEVVLQGTERADGAYDVVQSDFATTIAQEDIEERLAGQLADAMTARLAAFARQEAAKPENQGPGSFP